MQKRKEEIKKACISFEKYVWQKGVKKAKQLRTSFTAYLENLILKDNNDVRK